MKVWIFFLVMILCGSTQSPIKHIVVLMMENQSFDKMLGYLSKNVKGQEIGTLAKHQGEYYNYANPLDPKSHKYMVDKISSTHDGRPDPPHDFTSVTKQIFGTKNMTKPDMSGFASEFLLNYYNVENCTDFMKSFDPTQVPVISQLSRNFVVLRNWFSSVPGPTAPNRMFVHCGTSGGYAGGAYSRKLLYPYLPTMETIYNLMEEKKSVLEYLFS